MGLRSENPAMKDSLGIFSSLFKTEFFLRFLFTRLVSRYEMFILLIFVKQDFLILSRKIEEN